MDPSPARRDRDFRKRLHKAQPAPVLYSSPVQSEDILTQPPPAADSRQAYGDDPNQFVDGRVPSGKGPHPIVFFIHGGFLHAKYALTHTGHLFQPPKAVGIAS